MPKPLKPFFSYFGGKYRIAPKYPRPRWKTLIEPFAGSAGYSVRYPNRDVRLYDINPTVFGTWDYLIKASRKEVLALPLVFDDLRDLSICQEAKWLIGWWVNQANAQPCNVPGAWMRESMEDEWFNSPYNHTHWSKGTRSRIACQLYAIRHWKVYNRSYRSIANRRATWFVDPPYQESGKRYPFSGLDYAHLADWTKSRRGQVIACGEPSDTWIPFRPFVITRRRAGYNRCTLSQEVIWTKNA